MQNVWRSNVKRGTIFYWSQKHITIALRIVTKLRTFHHGIGTPDGCVSRPSPTTAAMATGYCEVKAANLPGISALNAL